MYALEVFFTYNVRDPCIRRIQEKRIVRDGHGPPVDKAALAKQTHILVAAQSATEETKELVDIYVERSPKLVRYVGGHVLPAV